MEVSRNSICIGGVFDCNIISLRNIRKIIFSYDLENNMGIDLVNKSISYPLKHNNSRSTFFIIQQFEVSTILENLGYPEILTDTDIDKLLSVDFSKVLIESGIFRAVQTILDDDSLSINCYKKNIEFAKNEFKLHDEELTKASVKKKIFKRGK